MEENTQLIEDDTIMIGSKNEVAERLHYNFKAAIEDADADYVKELANNFVEIMDEFYSNDESYVKVSYSFMDGLPSIDKFSNSFKELKQEWKDENE